MFELYAKRERGGVHNFEVTLWDLLFYVLFIWLCHCTEREIVMGSRHWDILVGTNAWDEIGLSKSSILNAIINNKFGKYAYPNMLPFMPGVSKLNNI